LPVKEGLQDEWNLFKVRNAPRKPMEVLSPLRS
jgi:hypothetical protein